MLKFFKNKKDRSLSFLHAEAASSSMENAGIAYQAPSLLASGGAAKDVALLSTATNLIFALLLVKLPSFIKSGDSLKKATIALALVSAVAWLPLILVPLLVPAVSVAILIPLWVISLIPALLIGPVRDKWMSDLLPADRLGRYFGLRQIVATGSYLTTFYLMGYLMDSFKAVMNNAFVLVFAIGFVGSLVSLLLYLAVRKSDVNGQDDGGRFGLLDFLHETKQNNMATFMLYVTLVTFAASISSAFFSVYMLQNLHFSYLTYTLVISVEFLARILSLIFWGKIVDKSGAIRLIKVVSFVIPVIPVLWLFSSNLFYLGLIQVCSGFAWAGFDLCNQTHICSASPESKRLHYIVYQRCVITFVSAAGPLIGAFLLTRIFTIFGSPILSIFLLSGLLRFAVVISMVFKLKAADSKTGAEQSEPSAVHVLYQAPRTQNSKGGYGFPKFEREQPRTTQFRAFTPLKLVKGHPGETSEKERTPGSPVSPYRQAQYAGYRQSVAETLKGPKKTTGCGPVVHRLSYN